MLTQPAIAWRVRRRVCDSPAMDLAIPLPDHLSARPAQRDDLPAMLAVLAAYEERVLGEALMDLEDLEADWERPSFDPDRQSLVVVGDGALVACGAVSGARADAAVHPDAWGRGIGAALVDWTSHVAAVTGATRVGQTVPDTDAGAAALFASRGWSPLYSSWVLEMPPGQAIPSRSLPDGYRLRAIQTAQDERAAYQVIEDAFNEWPNREPTSYDDWAATVLGRPGFERWQLLLAVVGDGAAEQVVGACHLVLSGDTGWVNQVGVSSAHRRRGVAQALLAASFRTARDCGAPRAELSTDSRTGALTRYERLGMRTKWAFTHWAGAPRALAARC